MMLFPYKIKEACFGICLLLYLLLITIEISRVGSMNLMKKEEGEYCHLKHGLPYGNELLIAERVVF